MRRTMLALSVVATLAACSASSVKPRSASTNAESPVSSPTASTNPTPSASAQAPLLTYVTLNRAGETIHVYDIARGTDSALIHGTSPVAVQFESPKLISYTDTHSKSLMEIAVHGGTPHLVFRSPVYIDHFAWSPNRKAVAFVGDEKNSLGIYVWNRGGSVTLERRLSAQGGKCGRVIGDESKISWSPDGTRILVSDTGLGVAGYSTWPTMYVVSRGKDVVTPRLGTEARWTSDGHSIIYMSYARPYHWYLLDTETGKQARLPLPPGDYAQINNAGTLLAYQQPSDLSLHVYDIETKTDQKVLSNATQPAWIGTRTLVALRVKSCNGCNCGANQTTKPSGWVRFDIGGKVYPLPNLPTDPDMAILDVISG